MEGSRLAKELCQKLSVHYNQVGSFVIAFNDEEAKTVEEIYERGVKTGVQDCGSFREEALKMEPNLNPKVQCALYAPPTAAIVNPWEFAIALAGDRRAATGGTLLKQQGGRVEKTADGCSNHHR